MWAGDHGVSADLLAGLVFLYDGRFAVWSGRQMIKDELYGAVMGVSAF